MARKREDPVRTEAGPPIGGYKETHPSYGQILITRCSGTSRSLYGSGISHNNTIRVSIKRSERQYEKHHEWMFGREELIEVELSSVQFAEMLTNMNVGSGVPCTLRYVAGEEMPECPSVNVKKQINEDIKEKMYEFAGTLEDLKLEANNILTGNKFLKADKVRLNGLLNLIFQELKGNIPFLHECMQEAVDKTVIQGKGELEAHFMNIINKLGLEELHKQQTKGLVDIPEAPQLSEGEED